MSRLSLVVAVADNGVIGRDNQLPWHIPADLKHFKRVTMGKPIIMGRKTYESIGRPLPGRQNIVLTRQASWSAAGVSVVASLDEAIALASHSATGTNSECMIIGGATLYAAALPQASMLYLTQVHASVSGDTFFPSLETAHWRELERTTHPADGDTYAYSFVTLERCVATPSL
ncbi:MAG: dihydrofolate reductase [Pseudomonadota bacterium]